MKVKQSKVVSFLFFCINTLLTAVFLFAVLLLAMAMTNNRTFAGYACFNILTNSMDSVYPQGSFIVTKQMTPEELKIGDDITYLVKENTTITHRIVEVIPDGTDEKRFLFQTKGVDNEYPDQDLVPEENVVGVVIACIPGLGTFLVYLRENMILFLSIVALLVLLVVILHKIKLLRKQEVAEEKDYPFIEGGNDEEPNEENI